MKMNVTLIGLSKFSLDNEWDSPEDLVEFAGRLCWNSTMTGDGKFITARVAEGHESIIEHSSASFLIEGVSRSLTHQIVRHRISSISMQSQRYIDGKKFGYVTPPEIAENEETLAIYLECLAHTRTAYERLRNKGIKKEDARFLLPNATTTSLVMTANFREWRHIIKERGLNKHAQWEIRELALEILKHLYDVAPNVFGDLYEEAFSNAS